MRAKTFDMLDSELLNEQKKIQDLTFNIRFSHLSTPFLLDPISWDKYYKELSPYNLQWKEFKYKDLIDNKHNLKDIINDDKIGLYMFIVGSNKLINSLPRFVLYVGISGAGGSNRPLHERLNDYFYVEKIKKRDAIHSLLIKWYSNIYVAYTLLDINIKNDVEKIEENLIGFFAPSANKDDMPAELSKVKKGFLR